jgi:hypothetical protein
MVRHGFYRETQTLDTIIGVNMAVKKSLMDGYSYKDLFDTQDALDSGELNQTQYGTETRSGSSLHRGLFKMIGIGGGDKTTNLMANKENLGSLLGKSDAISAYKKRKDEQLKTGQQGFGAQSSILGGGGF